MRQRLTQSHAPIQGLDDAVRGEYSDRPLVDAHRDWVIDRAGSTLLLLTLKYGRSCRGRIRSKGE